ncbi:hypothetical protein L2K70_02320 [Nocardioides KLBMP 9356]|uniref:Nucleotide exchange factor GrpE n=1 Tax=Nocardioides potassii TaxID=2911371 RepID=A0ABS9H8I8_9ACTN|nr:hypothetical protein [Nocardioides potassii]MCF6376428.1 hypothetical protein [Nocardioides potassii]
MPSPEKVLLRKSQDGSWSEVGVLRERVRGKTWRLLLPDGREVDHDIQASESFPERHSLQYRLKLDPDGVAADLETAPADVFLLALGGFRKGATSGQLKQAFVGIDTGVVDRAWRRAKKHLDASEVVTRSGSKVPTYTLVVEASRDSEAGEESTETPEDVVTTQSEGSAPEPVQQNQAHARDTPRLAASSDHDRPAEDDVLTRHLVSQGWDEAEAGLASLGQRPLRLGLTLGRLKATELSDLLQSLTFSQRAEVAVALGRGKDGLLETDTAGLSQAKYETALRRARAELDRDQASPSLIGALTSLLERVSATYVVPLSVAAELAGSFAKVAREGERKATTRAQARDGLNKALAAAAEAMKLASRIDSEAAPELVRLSQAARHVPFARTGGRSLLVATIYQLGPDRARSDAWWTDATFDDLAEAGHGPLANVLEDRLIAESVVRPLVTAAVDQAESRSRVGQIISAAIPVARWVSGETLRGAILRAARHDEVASAWAETLTDDRKLQRMESALAAARADVEASADKQLDLQRHVARLEQRLATVGEELAAARSAQGESRGAHDRQVRADLVRVLAKVAAQVAQSAAASEDEGLMRSVSHATRREGLDPIGEVDRQTTFDPKVHDSMGQSISAEAQVTVVRPGYTWRDGTDTLVLVKAQVVPTGE